jgi:hypothetical protein
MNLVEELDALKSALDIETASRAVVQSLLQRGEDVGSAGVVHDETIAMVVARARALVEKAGS